MKEYFCWRCNRVMPFLNEQEWGEIEPYLANAMKAILKYQEEYECDLHTARMNCKPEATAAFETITGVPGVHFEAMYHHRLGRWGNECDECGYLFRTPNARYCANCGRNKVDGG